jgi:hypothetical protein
LYTGDANAIACDSGGQPYVVSGCVLNSAALGEDRLVDTVFGAASESPGGSGGSGSGGAEPDGEVVVAQLTTQIEGSACGEFDLNETYTGLNRVMYNELTKQSLTAADILLLSSACTDSQASARRASRHRKGTTTTAEFSTEAILANSSSGTTDFGAVQQAAANIKALADAGLVTTALHRLNGSTVQQQATSGEVQVLRRSVARQQANIADIIPSGLNPDSPPSATSESGGDDNNDKAGCSGRHGWHHCNNLLGWAITFIIIAAALLVWLIIIKVKSKPASPRSAAVAPAAAPRRLDVANGPAAGDNGDDSGGSDGSGSDGDDDRARGRRAGSAASRRHADELRAMSPKKSETRPPAQPAPPGLPSIRKA